MSRRPPTDEGHLHRALRLARRGAGRVEPNPMVGCVIVKRGRIIGEGYHRRFGGAHAEIEALRRCKASPRGATVYVTLEPCCHEGKTGPCTAALLEACVGRVVAPDEDPNPQVAGRGFATLREAGVQVDVGLLRDAARALTAPFRKLVLQKQPWVILKWAQSLDGKIATHTGDSKWISDEACRAHAHRVRGRLDAVLVGAETVRRDDPLLTSRVGRPRRVATRVVLDSRLRTPTTAQLVRTAPTTPTWFFCDAAAASRRERALQAAGCVVHRVRSTRAGLSLRQVLRTLGRHGMTNVLVEGGGRLLGAFFSADLYDEVHLYLAPLLLGGEAAPGPLGGAGVHRVAGGQRHADLRPRRLGDGWLIQFRRTSSH